MTRPFTLARRTGGLLSPTLAGLLLTTVTACLASAPILSAQEEGTLRGRVIVRRPPPTGERPTVASFGTAARRTANDAPRSVVYLESAPRRAFDQIDAGRASMDQQNETFVPHVLAVLAGTTVEFPNSDRTYHNVFSLSKTARFDLGRYATGRSKSVRFDRTGIVRVFCDIHSHMNAFILVFSHPYFAVTDADGRYVIDHIPPGRYTVVAWHEGVVGEARAVTLQSNGSTDLDFSLR